MAKLPLCCPSRGRESHVCSRYMNFNELTLCAIAGGWRCHLPGQVGAPAGFLRPEAAVAAGAAGGIGHGCCAGRDEPEAVPVLAPLWVPGPRGLGWLGWDELEFRQGLCPWRLTQLLLRNRSASHFQILLLW